MLEMTKLDGAPGSSAKRKQRECCYTQSYKELLLLKTFVIIQLGLEGHFSAASFMHSHKIFIDPIMSDLYEKKSSLCPAFVTFQ